MKWCLYMCIICMCLCYLLKEKRLNELGRSFNLCPVQKLLFFSLDILLRSDDVHYSKVTTQSTKIINVFIPIHQEVLKMFNYCTCNDAIFYVPPLARKVPLYEYV